MEDLVEGDTAHEHGWGWSEGGVTHDGESGLSEGRYTAVWMAEEGAWTIWGGSEGRRASESDRGSLSGLRNPGERWREGEEGR